MKPQKVKIIWTLYEDNDIEEIDFIDPLFDDPITTEITYYDYEPDGPTAARDAFEDHFSFFPDYAKFLEEMGWVIASSSWIVKIIRPEQIAGYYLVETNVTLACSAEEIII
jgi:hypothetical protein